MAKAKFSELISEYNSTKRKLNIFLLIQAPIVFLLLAKIMHVRLSLSPPVIMSFLMLLWFYWFHLMVNLLLMDIKIICDNMHDDFADQIPDECYNRGKLKKTSLFISLITLLFGLFAYMKYSIYICLLVVVIGMGIDYFYRIKFAYNSMLFITKAYSNNFMINVDKFDRLSFKNILIPNAVLGLIYLGLLIYLLKLPPIYYVIYYVVFNILALLSITTLAQIKQFKRNIEMIDSVRST